MEEGEALSLPFPLFERAFLLRILFGSAFSLETVLDRFSPAKRIPREVSVLLVGVEGKCQGEGVAYLRSR